MSISHAVSYLILWGGLAVVIVLLGLLLHGFDYLESDSTSETNHHQNRANEDQQQGDPVASAITSYEKRRDAHERERASREAITARVFTATGGFALIAAIAAIYSGIILTQQASDFRDQERRQLRAYTYVKPPPAGIQGVEVGQTPHAIIALRNSGRTPAYEMHVRGNIGIGPHPLPPRPTFIEGPFGGKIVLNPETEMTTGGVISESTPFTAEDIASIKEGIARRLYIFGTITYTDAFNEKRISDFCFGYFGIGPTLVHMEYCDVHNDQN